MTGSLRRAGGSRKVSEMRVECRKRDVHGCSVLFGDGAALLCNVLSGTAIEI